MVSIPVFFLVLALIKRLEIAELEASSFAFTIMVMGGIFVGRYIGGILVYRRNTYPRRLLVTLSVITLLLIIWISFYSEFPLMGRPSIGILLLIMPLAALSVIIGLMIKVV